LVKGGIVTKDDNFIGVVDVGFVKSLLLKRRSVYKKNVLEPRDLVPNL
jgi:hypothetical protein